MSSDLFPVHLLHPEATLPRRAKQGDAGLDIYALGDGLIPAHSQVLIKTGIAMAIPIGYYGQLATRSGMAVKGLVVVGGVIDSGYRGEIGICIHNNSDVDFLYSINPETGEKPRIAQMILLKVPFLEPVAVEELSTTERGIGGFGSTGV